MFDEWHNSVKDLISSIDSSIREMKKLKLNTEGKRTLFEIEKILQKIKFDGSSGVHNYMFFDEVLTDLKKKIESIGKATR
jgi:prefoldin subunit 5